MSPMNPMMFMKLQGLWGRFTQNHPKFPMFMSAVYSKGIPEDTIIEISITYPNGEKAETNLKVRPDDLEMFETLKQMRQ